MFWQQNYFVTTEGLFLLFDDVTSGQCHFRYQNIFQYEILLWLQFLAVIEDFDFNYKLVLLPAAKPFEMLQPRAFLRLSHFGQVAVFFLALNSPRTHFSC